MIRLTDEEIVRMRTRAIQYFWATKLRQKENQESRGKKDQGNRGSVTGGQQLNGFIEVLRDILIMMSISEESIFTRKNPQLPGYFRPSKQWDMLVVDSDRLIAAIEAKSIIGSLGNNANNRVEEALGSAEDLWAAHKYGAFQTQPRPWLGYLLVMEDSVKSNAPVSVKEPHFPVFEDFRNASYAKRMEVACEKLVRESKYDATCLILTDRETGIDGTHREPNPELSFGTFIRSFCAHVTAFE